MGNQYYLVIENPIEQTDSVNFGFRVDNMFGNDWQFNYMQGLFNRAFPPDHFAGYDLSQLYGEAHLPILTPGGLDVKGGLWYTLAGYEQVPAIARPLLSVPYMFNYGQPFRHVGVVTTLHLTAADQPLQRHDQRLGPLDRRTVHLGLHRRLQLGVRATRRPTSPSPASGGPTSSRGSCPANQPHLPHGLHQRPQPRPARRPGLCQ